MEGDAMTFRSHGRIAEGEEVTRSYLGDEDLLTSTLCRRRKLLESGKDFLCNCTRCASPLDRCRSVICPSCRGGIIYLGQAVSTIKEIWHRPFESAHYGGDQQC